MDLGKKIKTGVESEPIKAPDFTPIHVPERVATPERETVLVPIRR
jgi:hypothetical protein